MNPGAAEITEQLARQLLELTGDQRQGLPAPVFRLVSQLTPLINVDLLIRDEQGNTLLTWRADEFYGPGWHIPGGIIRFKENIATRISKVAESELGCLVTHQAQPLAMHEIMAPHRDVRGHFISFLYVCTLQTEPRADLQAQESPPQNGEWKWHATCPDDLISVHERYRPYIARAMPVSP
jgi:ADP-ribose pyrophosphatase YjhB (NUDIX family)